jgi:hypothetical protein
MAQQSKGHPFVLLGGGKLPKKPSVATMKQKQKIDRGNARVARKGGASWSARPILAADLANVEKQLRLLREPDAEELADRISIFRTRLAKHAGVRVAIDHQKVHTLRRLAKLLMPNAVQREEGESQNDAVARLYGWQTNEELERMLHFLESGEPG